MKEKTDPFFFFNADKVLFYPLLLEFSQQQKMVGCERHGQFPMHFRRKLLFRCALLLKMPSSSDQKKKINDRCNSRKKEMGLPSRPGRKQRGRWPFVTCTYTVHWWLYTLARLYFISPVGLFFSFWIHKKNNFRSAVQSLHLSCRVSYFHDRPWTVEIKTWVMMVKCGDWRERDASSSQPSGNCRVIISKKPRPNRKYDVS